MRKFERTKKLLSVLLAVVMVLSYVPVRAMAEECSHHRHDENCGYKEAVEGSACTHQHTESCTEEVTVCIHVHSEEAGCVLTPAAEAVACDHDCANGDCGYVAAQEAVPCTCGAQPQHDAACTSVITEGAECNCTTTLTHGEGCEPKDAVEGAPCDHTHGSCAYREAVEESWSCDHTCAKDNGCITVKENCSHVCPADDCGFVEAVEASPCTFVCEECLNEDVCPECESTGGAHSENCLKAVCPFCGNLNEAHSETCSTRCTSAEGCIDGQHGAECPLYICSVCNTKPCVCSTPELTDTDDGCGYFGCSKTTESHLFLLHKDGNFTLHEINQNIGYGMPCTLWFYNKETDENIEITGNADVTFPAFVTYNDGWLNLVRAGEGAITYGDYSISVVSNMPDVGIFSEANRTPEKLINFIDGKQGQQKTVYLMWSDSVAPAAVEVTADGKPVTVISPTPKEGTTNVIVLGEPDITAKYIEVTIELPFDNWITFTVRDSNNDVIASYQVEKTWEENQGGQGGNEETDTHPCNEEGPHLFLKDKNKNKYYHDLKLTIGSGQICHPYFCNAEGKDIPLSFEDLVFPDFLSPISTVDVSAIEAIGVGEGVIAYTDETNGGPYELEVIASLPKYGFYTDKERNEANFTTVLKGNSGDKNTLYLMWDAENPKCTPVDSLAAMTGENAPFEGCTKVEEGTGYLKIEITIPDAPAIRFQLLDSNDIPVGDVVLQRESIDNNDGEIPTILEIQYKESTVTVGIGTAMGPQRETLVLNERGGFSYKHGDDGTDGGMDTEVCLAAFVNYGGVGGEEGVANKFLEEIMKSGSVKFEFTSWENSSYDDADRPSLTVYEGTAANVPTIFARMQSEPKKFGHGYLVMSFTYDGKEYKTSRYISYKDSNVSLDISEQTDLKAIFESGDAFLTWLNGELAKTGDKYDGTGFIDLYLPEKNYEEIIEIDLSFENPNAGRLNAVRLYGHKNGTTMKGLVVKNKVFVISSIDFIGNGGTAIKHDPDKTDENVVLGSITECTFNDYTCGIEDVGYGYVRSISKCLFYECDTGVRLNSKPVESTVVENDIAYQENWFMNNSTAVSIENLPKGMSAFRTRIHENTFLFCDLEFNMVPTGTFYFLRNYYGGQKRGSAKFEDWEHPGNKADEEIRHHARIAEADKSGTKTVTNPVRKTIQRPYEYWIYADVDQHAAIFSGEKDRILVDGETFTSTASNENSRAANGEMPVSILDNNGNELAKWTF